MSEDHPGPVTTFEHLSYSLRLLRRGGEPKESGEPRCYTKTNFIWWLGIGIALLSGIVPAIQIFWFRRIAGLLENRNWPELEQQLLWAVLIIGCWPLLNALSWLVEQGLNWRSRYIYETAVAKKKGLLSIDHMERREVKDRVRHATENSATRPWQFLNLTISITRNLAALAAVFFVIGSVSPTALLFIFMGSILVYGAERLWGRTQARLERDLGPQWRKQWGARWPMFLPKTIADLRSQHLYSFFRQRFANLLHGIAALQMQSIRRQFRWHFGAYLVLGLVLCWGFYGVVELVQSTTGQVAGAPETDKASSGAFASFCLALLVLGNSVAALFANLGRLHGETLIMNYIHGLLEEPEADQRNGTGQRLTGIPRITIEQVSFTYPNAAVSTLKGLDFVIEPGDRVAIVGRNGAGKTTLINLLTGLRLATHGTIRIDGSPLQELDLDSFRDNLSVMSQEFPRYEGLTIRECIVMGFTGGQVNSKRLEDALRISRAADFIDDRHKCPAGLDTVLGTWHDGADLSVGEWQKLALARVIYRGGAVMLFDEPTSAIDAFTVDEIFHDLLNWLNGRTAIFIIHQLSLARLYASKIVVMDEGRVVENGIGTHEQLLSGCPLYHEMYERQRLGYSDSIDDQRSKTRIVG